MINDIFPELSAYPRSHQIHDLADNLRGDVLAVRSAFGRRGQISTAQRIISGCAEAADGDPYTDDLIEHVWRCLEQLNRNPRLAAGIAARMPSLDFMRKIFWGPVATLSGRIRGHVGYTQRANTPFQGLAADGNKLALFSLLRNGFQVCGFVHDEMLILIPDGTDYDHAVDHVQQILIEAMQELTPDVPICCEYLLADRWYKGIDEQPRDENSRIIPATGQV